MDSKQINLIKKVIEELIAVMRVDPYIEVEISKDFPAISEPTVAINIKSQSGSLLIGRDGSNIPALEHMIRLLVAKKIGKDERPPFFIIDINDYRKQKIEQLKDLAERIGREVKLKKKPVELKPMPAYERRIIHLSLANSFYVTTESIGEEPERRVVVKLKSKI